MKGSKRDAIEGQGCGQLAEATLVLSLFTLPSYSSCAGEVVSWRLKLACL